MSCSWVTLYWFEPGVVCGAGSVAGSGSAAGAVTGAVAVAGAAAGGCGLGEGGEGDASSDWRGNKVRVRIK